MLKKIVTTAGLVSVFGASAVMAAPYDLSDATAVTPIYYASETLGATAGSQAGSGVNVGTTFFNVKAGANADLDVVMTTAFVAAVKSYYVKVDLTNAAFAASPGTMTLNAGAAGSATAVFFSGGALGSSSAIYTLAVTVVLTADTTLTHDIVTLGTNGNPSVTMSIFDTITEANSATGTPITTKTKNTVSFKAGNIATTTPAIETAEVSSAFLKYKQGTSTDLVAELGATAFTLATLTSSAQDGANIAAADLFNSATSVVTVTGDLSNGTWWLSAAGCAAFAAPPTADKLTLTAAKTSGTATLAKLITNGTLCNVVGGATAIPTSAYSIGVNYAAATGSTGATDSTGVSLGSVIRNGTTQNINYLTTFASYNQRVFITNRGTVDATYSFTFQSEDGVTATAGTAATGTSKAGTVLALKASDIVTLTGKTRTAATLAIVGTPALFGIATQQVNLSNGATDTVVYKKD